MSASSSIDLAQFRIAWAVERADGPASRWPMLKPEPEIAQYCQDRQGMGVPAECLPMALSPYSVCGLMPAIEGGSLVLKPGAKNPRTGTCEPVNAEGCRRHLELNRETATRAFIAWKQLQSALAEMEAKKPPKPLPSDQKPKLRWNIRQTVPGTRWARYA